MWSQGTRKRRSRQAWSVSSPTLRLVQLPDILDGLGDEPQDNEPCLRLAPKPIHYYDTDSVFVGSRFDGKIFALSDTAGEFTVPVILETKAQGAHPYIFLSEDPEGYAVHGVLNSMELQDWFRIMNTLPEATEVTRQVRGQIRARSKKAEELQFGRWYYEKQEAKLDRLNEIFDADDKRHRERYDSYNLVREGRWVGSRAWTSKEFYELKMRDEDFAVSLPSGKEYPNNFVDEWLKRFSKSPQFIG